MKTATAKKIGEKTMELDGVRVWKGKGSTFYMRIGERPITISKTKHEKLHKEMEQAFIELDMMDKEDDPGVEITLGAMERWMNEGTGRTIHVNVGWGIHETVHTLEKMSGDRVHYVHGDGQQFTYDADRTFRIDSVKGDYMTVLSV